MARRSLSLLGQLRTDLLALLLVVLLGLAYYFHVHPMLIERSDPEVEGTQPPPGAEISDTLLLLPTLDASPALSFSGMDMAYGWYNILSQELGSFSHMPPSQMKVSDLTNRRMVVVSASATQALSVNQIKMLARWTEGGGVLLVEQPDARWSEPLGLGLTDELRTTKRITSATGTPSRGAMLDALLEVPILSTMRPAKLSSSPGTVSPDILLEVDGKPAMIHRKRGDGHAYILTFDLARAVMTLQQGKPAEDFSIPAPEDATALPEGTTQPYQLVADEKMLNTQLPLADILERNVMEITARDLPLPRLWYFPGQKMGVYIMSHDEESFGDKALFMTDWEAEHDYRSTSFIIPGPMSPASMEKMLEQGHDVQLHWNRGFLQDHTTTLLGLGPWRPVALEMNLREQRAFLEEAMEGRAVALNRIHGLVWDQDWSASFRKLAAARVVADSTYGPTGPKQFGYLFGTGLPFYPLDHSGRLLPVAEIPFVLQDDENLQPSRHRRLISQSESGYHQVIMPIYHSNTMANRPSADVIQSWRKIFRYAERRNHWVTTLQDYMLFEEARRASTVSSRFYPQDRRLEIEVNLVKPRIKYKKERRERDARSKRQLCPSLAFPQQHRNNSVESVRVDEALIPLRRLGRSGDGFYHTLALPCGPHKVQLSYGGRSSALEGIP